MVTSRMAPCSSVSTRRLWGFMLMRGGQLGCSKRKGGDVGGWQIGPDYLRTGLLRLQMPAPFGPTQIVRELNGYPIVMQQLLPLLQYGLGHGFRQRAQGQTGYDGADLAAWGDKPAEIGGVAMHNIHVRKALAQTLHERAGKLDHQQAIGGYAMIQQRLGDDPCA